MKSRKIIIGVVFSVVYGYIYLLTIHNTAPVKLLNIEIKNFHLIVFNLLAAGTFALLNCLDKKTSLKTKSMFVWIIQGMLLMCLPGREFIVPGSLIAASGIIATSIKT